MTLVQICYLTVYRPFEVKLVGNLEIMNECFTVLLMYHVICLNDDFVIDEYGREIVGVSFVVFLLSNVFLNFYFLFRTIFRDRIDK